MNRSEMTRMNNPYTAKQRKAASLVFVVEKSF